MLANRSTSRNAAGADARSESIPLTIVAERTLLKPTHHALTPFQKDTIVSNTANVIIEVHRVECRATEFMKLLFPE